MEDVLPCAEQGDAFAQTNLGLMYENGEGVPEDDVLAYTRRPKAMKRRSITKT